MGANPKVRAAGPKYFKIRELRHALLPASNTVPGTRVDLSKPDTSSQARKTITSITQTDAVRVSGVRNANRLASEPKEAATKGLRIN